MFRQLNAKRHTCQTSCTGHVANRRNPPRDFQVPAKKSKKAPVSQKKNKELPSEEQGKRLDLLLSEMKIDQTILGQRARVDQAAISRWIDGKRDMATLSMLRVAQALGVSLHWLLTGDGPRVPETTRPFVRVDPSVAGDVHVHARAGELLSDPPRPSDDGAKMHRWNARK